MADMLARDLAAFDIGSEAAAPSASSDSELPTAVARAEGVLVGLADGSALAREFARLLDAVQSSIPVQRQQHRAG